MFKPEDCGTTIDDPELVALVDATHKLLEGRSLADILNVIFNLHYSNMLIIQEQYTDESAKEAIADYIAHVLDTDQKLVRIAEVEDEMASKMLGRIVGMLEFGSLDKTEIN